MKIDALVLESIRSHTKSTVLFSHGFNCVVGGVGCGKSSLLYAIDFALFGDIVSGRTFDYLLREGCDCCKVTLQFTQNGNIYKLTRGLRRRGKSILQDIEQLKLYEDEQLVASMKTDAIAEQLRAITGLDRELYREIVWFRQEHLKELLDAKPRDRQTRLDQLFGLADYEVAWTHLAQYRRDYENELSFFQKDPDVNSIEKLNADYNRASEEFMGLEMDLETAEQRVSRAKNGWDEAETELKRLEDKKQAMEELKRQEARLSANLTNTARSVADLAEQVEGKKIIISNFLQRQTSLDSQIKLCTTKLEQAGLPSCQQLDQLNTLLAGFDEKITSLRAEQEATSRSLQQDQKRMLQLGTGGGECPLCSQALSGDYRTDLLHSIQHDNDEREKLVNRLRIDAAELQKNKRDASEAISSLQQCLARSGDFKARIAEEESNLKKLNDRLEVQRRVEADQRIKLEKLQAEIVGFNFDELQASKIRKDQAMQVYYAVQSDLKTKQNRKADLARRLDDTKDRIDQAQQKLERMDKIRLTVELLSAIRDAYRSIQPKLRMEFVKVLQNFVQQVLDSLVGGETQMLNVVIDESYTPYVKSEAGVNREVSNLSGGERTLLAFAYRLGLGQLIMQSRTGHGLSMLMLDEPTENLGSEDGSIERLAEAISRFKAIEQIIAVTHSEAFAAKGDHVVVLEKEAGISKISIER